MIKKDLSKDQVIVDFPLTGELSMKNLGERLEEIDANNEKYNLLIHIGFNQQPEIVNDFLISLCLLKKFYYYEDVYNLPPETGIFIEV